MVETFFHKITLPQERNLFEELSQSANFVETGKGRVGNHLVKISENGVSIVRTTTQYSVPAHDFAPIHNSIVEELNETIKNSNYGIPQLDFNNALIEIYNKRHTKMGYHSDQCLDINKDSYFGLYTCYENPEELTEQFTRKLKVMDKETEEEFEIKLTHNSIVLFSYATNSKFSHKIVLEPALRGIKQDIDNRWLGVTFRKSKEFIKFENGLSYFSDGKQLKLADENQRSEFFKLRGEENKNMDFVYPRLLYTLSLADTLLPKKSIDK